MEDKDFYTAEFIRSVINRKYNVGISVLDVWSEYRNGNVKSFIRNGEVLFNLAELMVIFNPKKGGKKRLKDRVKENVIQNYLELWGKPLTDDYNSETDWKITPIELITYNSNRVKAKPLYLKESNKDE